MAIIAGYILLDHSDKKLSPGTSPKKTSANVYVPKFGTRLMAMDATSQASLLGQTAGEGCHGDYAFYRGIDSKGSDYWSVHCLNGKSYEIQISPAGTKVLDCAVVKLMTGDSCFSRFQQVEPHASAIFRDSDA